MRGFEDDQHTIAISRDVLTRIAGTMEIQKTVAAVVGMSALPAVVQQMSSAQALKVIGKVDVQVFTLDVDNDVLPSGGVLKVGDTITIASGIYAGDYDIIDARLVQNRVWNCAMQVKPESKS